MKQSFFLHSRGSKCSFYIPPPAASFFIPLFKNQFETNASRVDRLGLLDTRGRITG